MKRSIFLFAICFAVLPTFSQNKDSLSTSENSIFLPTAGDWGFSIVIDGLINDINIGSKSSPFGNNILFGRYYKTDQLAYRVGFGLDYNNDNRELADSVGQSLVEVDSSFKNVNLSISFGLEKHLPSFNRLDPYLAADIALAFIGKNVREINRRETDATGTNRTDRTITQDGGLGVNLSGSLGFNYFLAPRFSIGSELGIGFTVLRTGGAITDNTIDTPVNGTASADYETRIDKSTDINMGVNPSAAIHISYFF